MCIYIYIHLYDNIIYIYRERENNIIYIHIIMIYYYRCAWLASYFAGWPHRAQSTGTWTSGVEE